ncbi:MAG: flavodoxin family protein [Denitrovibrio sp.]|nr:MAG: flavodoxin family protein [Denitrovibrio sp.]
MHNKILIIGSSPRRGGNSDIIIEHFAKGAENAGCESEIVQLSGLNISPCVGCERCRKDKSCTRLNDDMTDIYEKIKHSKGLFMVSPVHNYNVTAWMKAFIDRMYCFYDFKEPRPNDWSSRLSGQNRQAVAAAVCEQLDVKDMGFTIEAMTMPLEALGYEVKDHLRFLGVFSKGAISEVETALKKSEESGYNLAVSLKN